MGVDIVLLSTLPLLQIGHHCWIEVGLHSRGPGHLAVLPSGHRQWHGQRQLGPASSCLGPTLALDWAVTPQGLPLMVKCLYSGGQSGAGWGTGLCFYSRHPAMIGDAVLERDGGGLFHEPVDGGEVEFVVGGHWEWESWEWGARNG